MEIAAFRYTECYTEVAYSHWWIQKEDKKCPPPPPPSNFFPFHAVFRKNFDFATIHTLARLLWSAPPVWKPTVNLSRLENVDDHKHTHVVIYLN